MWFPQYLVERKILSMEDVFKSIARYEENKCSIGQFSIDAGYLSKDQVRKALDKQAEDEKGFLSIAVGLGFVSDEVATTMAGEFMRFTNHWDHLVQHNLLRRSELDRHLREFHQECFRINKNHVVFV